MHTNPKFLNFQLVSDISVLVICERIALYENMTVTYCSRKMESAGNNQSLKYYAKLKITVTTIVTSNQEYACLHNNNERIGI